MVRLTPRDAGAELGIADLAGFLRFAQSCFRQKRKTLRNNLAPYYGSKITAQPESGLRAEQLTVDQLRDLHARVTS